MPGVVALLWPFWRKAAHTLPMAEPPSPVLLALVKSFEAYCPEPVRLPDGRWLMGYGHVAAEPRRLDPEEAEAQLNTDLARTAAAVRAAIPIPLPPNQIDALTAFAFSIGREAFAKSDVLANAQAGDMLAAGQAIAGWRLGAQAEAAPLEALVRRRTAEQALFWREPVPGASALLRARRDPAFPARRAAFGVEDGAGFAGLGLAGLVLVALGVSIDGAGLVLMAAPGGLAVLMAFYHLLKHAAR